MIGRYKGISLCISQDQQKYSLIIHDKFEDLFTTVTKMSIVFPQWYKYIGNKLRSYMHKAISTKVQGKTCFETKLNKIDQTFWFSIFMCFWIFYTKKKKKMIKAKNAKAFNAKANKQPVDNSNNQQEHNQT